MTKKIRSKPLMSKPEEVDIDDAKVDRIDEDDDEDDDEDEEDDDLVTKK